MAPAPVTIPPSEPVAARKATPGVTRSLPAADTTVASASTSRAVKAPVSPTPSEPPAAETAVTPASAPVATTHSKSLNVVHLHRLGNCRGRLEVTRDGIVFVSDGGGKDDAFALKYAEFVNALSDDTLIMRSADKTYRFKPAAPGIEGKTQLRDLADTIARSRR